MRSDVLPFQTRALQVAKRSIEISRICRFRFVAYQATHRLVKFDWQSMVY
jgi:hypothetical protein